MQTVLYYIVYGFFRLLALLPLKVLYMFSWVIRLLLYHGIRYRRGIVAENLRNAFPERGKEDLLRIEKQYYAHMCDLIVETIYQSGMSASEVRKRVVYTNPELVEQYYRQGRHVAGILGHCNNWEWMFGFPLFTNLQCVVIYRPVSSRVIDRVMLKIRSRFGADLVPMKVAPRRIYQYDREGVPTITAFIADQSPPPGSTPQWLTFLHRETAFYSGPELIARKMSMAAVYLKMKKVRRGFYEFEFVPLTTGTGEIEPGELIRAYAAKLERHINEEPAHWLWSHRRWKRLREATE